MQQAWPQIYSQLNIKTSALNVHLVNFDVKKKVIMTLKLYIGHWAQRV